MINDNEVQDREQRAKRLPRSFWLLNLLLIVLYLWTLTEKSTVAIAVEEETCVAILPQRSLSISCPGLRNGVLGLYGAPQPGAGILSRGPLDWLAPETSWGDLRLYDDRDQLRWTATFNDGLREWRAVEGTWRTRLGELRPPSDAAFIRRQETLRSLGDEYRVVARLRRPHDSAGLVLLDPDGRQGWAFITSAYGRRGTWWRWQDGQPQEPLVGIPYQKPFLAQFQSLLRDLLRAHQWALLLLATAWFLYGRRRSLPPAIRRKIDPLSVPSHRPVIMIIILLVFALTLYVAVDLLERIPHVQDAVTYLFQAKTLAGGQLWAPAPPLPELFEQEFLLVQDGRWFGKYPPGFPAVLALGVLIDTPWLVNPFLATLIVPLLYVLGRTLYNRATGLLGASLTLASPFFLITSGNMMAHTAELLWSTIFMISWLKALCKPRQRRWPLVAGLALGLLFLTRQLSAVTLALPFVAFTVLSWPSPDGAGRRQTRKGHLLGRSPFVRPLVTLALACLPLLFLLPAYQWALTGDPLQDPRLLYWEYDHLGFGQDIGAGQNAFGLEMTAEGPAQIWFNDPAQPPRGHSPSRGLYNVEQNVQALQRHLFGWPPALTLSFLWLAFLLGRPRRQDWALLLPALLLGSTYVFYWADGISYGPRYFYVALPAFLLLTARGARMVARRQGGRAGRWIVVLFLLALVAGSYAANTAAYLETYRGYNFVDRRRLDLIEAGVQEPALVFVDAGGDWWEYGSVFSANTPWLDGPLVVARTPDTRSLQALTTHFPQRRVYRLVEDRLMPLDGSP